MIWFLISSGASIILMLRVAATDIATRIISNTACLMLALLAILRLPLSDPPQLLWFVAGTALLFAFLLILHGRGYVGGGDVKLLVALSIGLSLAQLVQFFIVMTLVGGGLALAHLMLRLLPTPGRPPRGSSCLRRVYAVERWRHLRRAPLPYGVAIACGGISVILNQGA